MELYLDSANPQEIEQAFKLGFIYGLTTTPTFMHRDGASNVDETIKELAGIVPVLQVEALGKSAEEIVDEAERILALGLKKEKTVFKIPISLEGARACKMLRDKDLMVNMHLIYTIQQAYIALSAGATYVCPLVGRLQDQGHDALDLVAQCVDAVDIHGYPSKIMFSSVRHPEHVRNAINLGSHACTIPWKVLQQLTENTFTDIGAQQFFEHTRMMTLKVKDVMKGSDHSIGIDKKVLDALVVMTRSRLGAVALVDGDSLKGIFTDGDLRRMLETDGDGILKKTLSDLKLKKPLSINADELLQESARLFKENRVDNLIVVNGEKVVGILDIQDIIE